MPNAFATFDPLKAVRAFREGEQWANEDIKNEKTLERLDMDLEAARRKAEADVLLAPIQIDNAQMANRRQRLLNEALPTVISDQQRARSLGIVGVETAQANAAQDRATLLAKQQAADEINAQLVSMGALDFEQRKAILDRAGETGVWPNGKPLTPQQHVFVITARNQLEAGIAAEEAAAQRQANYETSIEANIYGRAVSAAGRVGAGGAGKAYKTQDDLAREEVAKLVQKGMPVETAVATVRKMPGFENYGLTPAAGAGGLNPIAGRVYDLPADIPTAAQIATEPQMRFGPINATPPAPVMGGVAPIVGAAPAPQNMAPIGTPQGGFYGTLPDGTLARDASGQPIRFFPDGLYGMRPDGTVQLDASGQLPANDPGGRIRDSFMPIVGNFLDNIRQTGPRFNAAVRGLDTRDYSSLGKPKP